MNIEETFNNDFQKQNFDNTLFLIRDPSNVPSNHSDYCDFVRTILKLFRTTQKCPKLLKLVILDFLYGQTRLMNENAWILLKEIQILGVLLAEYYNDHSLDVKARILKCFNTYVLLYFRDMEAFMSCQYRCCSGTSSFLTTKDCYKLYQITCKTIVETEQTPLTPEQLCDHFETLIITHNFSGLAFSANVLPKPLYSAVRNKFVQILNEGNNSQLLIDTLIFISICNEKILDKSNLMELRKLIINYFSSKDLLFDDNFMMIIVIFLSKNLSVPVVFQDFKTLWKFDDLKRIIAYFVRTEQQKTLVYLGFDLISYIKSADSEWSNYFSVQLTRTNSLLDDVIKVCRGDSDYQAVSGWKLLSNYVKDPSDAFMESVIDTLNYDIPRTTKHIATHGTSLLQWSTVHKIVRTLEAVTIVIELPSHKTDAFFRIATKKELQKSIACYLDAFFLLYNNQLLKMADIIDCVVHADIFCENKHWYLKASKLAVSLLYILYQFKTQFSATKISELLKKEKASALFALMFSQSQSCIYNVMTLSLVCDGILTGGVDVHRLSKQYENFMTVTKQIFWMPDNNKRKSMPLSADLKSLAEKMNHLDLVTVNGHGDTSDLVNMLKLRISALTEQNASKNAQLAQKQEYIGCLQESLAGLEKSYSEVSWMKDNLTRQNIELARHVKEVEHANCQLQQTNQELNEEMNQMHEKIDRLLETVTMKDGQLVEGKQTIVRLEKEVTEFESRCESSKFEIQRLETDIKEKAEIIKKNDILMSQVKNLFKNQS